MGNEAVTPTSPPPTPHPSRPPADPPSPSRGEGRTEAAEPSSLPSPLEGEGARRADEGCTIHKRVRTEWRTAKTPVLRGFAKTMRHKPTEAEGKLWSLLRDRRLANYKFRRQLPLGRYIADFVCLSHRLIIEADGSQHTELASDSARDDYLRAQGFRILRLYNHDILAHFELVLDAIWNSLQVSS